MVTSKERVERTAEAEVLEYGLVLDIFREPQEGRGSRMEF